MLPSLHTKHLNYQAKNLCSSLLAPVGRCQVLHASISASAPSCSACWRLGMTSGTQGVIGRGRWQVTGVNVELTEMVETNNGATFRCYFSKLHIF